MPEQLLFPKQATHEHLDGAFYWKDNALFTLEFSAIRSHCIERAANDAKAGHPADWVGLWNDIQGAGYTLPPKILPTAPLMKAAADGSVQHQAPGDTEVLGWKVAVWAGFLLELMVFALQMLLAGEWSPPLLILAVVLGVGGILLGMGLGDMLFSSWLKTWFKGTEQDMAGNQAHARVGQLVTGLAIVAGAVFVRAMGTPARVRVKAVLVTLALGLMVAAFEMMKVYKEKIHKRLADDMERVQRNFAHEEHKRSEEKYQQVYLQHYGNAVRQGPHAAALELPPLAGPASEGGLR